MKDKKFWGYMLLVVVVAFLAFSIDILSSQLTIELGMKKVLGAKGNVITTTEIVYPLWHQIANLMKNFLYGLSAAIFITVFVANKLEKSQRKEQAEELRLLNNAINVNVFDSLFKTIIPEEIFKIIKQEIIENKVMRKDAKWLFDFKEVNGKILCTQTTRYELHNLSQASVSDPIKLSLDELGGEKYSVLSAECLSSTGEKLVTFDPKGEKNENICVERDGNKTTVAYTVNIPAESYVEYKTVFQRSYSGDITDAQGTKVPVIGLDIIATYPEGYDFDISPMMSSPHRLITNNSTQKIYKVFGGILPHQGIVFYLKKIQK